jgi:hypothetical protein
MEKSFLKLLATKGFSVIPCKSDKSPDGAWKKYQTESRTPEEVERLNAPLYGIVTGYNNLEVIDIDLKVFSSLKEMQDFWNEYILFLKDNIDDFDKKFVIKKTKNKGYHILYRCSEVQGNTKIARLKGHQEAIIETRGIGGMVILYPDTFSDLNYQDIQEITPEDRFILWSCSKTYNYTEDIQPEVKPKIDNIEDTQLKPWDDYNAKQSIFDVISDDFTIVRTLSDKYIIKRHGASSPHSGYVYKNSGCMFLFSTGTCYPAEKLITPFIAYAHKFHFGDFAKAGSELYQKGFGTRSRKLIKEPAERIEININDLNFPIDIFPKPIQSYIIACNETLDSSIDYMGCSLLWLISVSIGNAMNIEVKKGWCENSTIWISVVGKAGLGKTPSINNIVFPLLKLNSKEIKKYYKQLDKFEYFSALSKKEQGEQEQVFKPTKTQFIANDITLEALVDLHQESDNAIGVFKDELAGWLKDMNKYRDGSDLEFWLSTWSGKAVNLNRLSRRGSFVENPLIPVLGGIQPTILNSFYTEENKENGFMDRMLLSFPDLVVDSYNEKEMDSDIISWYNDTIISFYETIKLKVIKRDDDGIIEPLTCKLSDDAKTEWKRIFNEITEIQNDQNENEYMKSMLPKQKSYIPRFALLIHVFNDFFSEGGNSLLISKDSVLKAEKISKYFIATAKKIKVNSVEFGAIKTIVLANKNKSSKEKFIEIYKSNPNVNKKEVAELLGVSLQSIYNYIKEL